MGPALVLPLLVNNKAQTRIRAALQGSYHRFAVVPVAVVATAGQGALSALACAVHKEEN